MSHSNINKKDNHSDYSSTKKVIKDSDHIDINYVTEAVNNKVNTSCL